MRWRIDMRIENALQQRAVFYQSESHRQKAAAPAIAHSVIYPGIGLQVSMQSRCELPASDLYFGNNSKIVQSHCVFAGFPCMARAEFEWLKGKGEMHGTDKS